MEKIATANGANSCRITGNSALVALMYHTARGCPQIRLETMLTDLWNLGLIHDPENPNEPLDSRLLCLRAIANLRDSRGGKGERDLGRMAWAWLAREHPEVFRLNLNWLASEGCRLDDLLHFGAPGVARLTSLLLTDQRLVVEHLHETCARLVAAADAEPERDQVYQFLVDLEHAYEGSPILRASPQLRALLRLTPQQILGHKGYLAEFLELSQRELEDQNCIWSSRPITLAAKWAPTERSACDRKLGKGKKTLLVSELLPRLELTPRQYRKCLISPLRLYLDIMERRMCQNQWNKIALRAVPSVALTKNRRALSKHVPDAMAAYMADVKSGKVKIKADQVMVHDLVRQYLGYEVSDLDPVIEEQFKALVEKYAHHFGERAVSLVDVSGSMSGTPMEVAIGLGLLTAQAQKFCLGENRERLEAYLETDAGREIAGNLPALWQIMSEMGLQEDGKPKRHPLAGKVITFETRPQLFTIPEGASLQDQVRQLAGAPWGGSTNFQAALELLLRTAMDADLHPRDFPEVLYVFSDMQFNSADSNFYTNHKVLKQKFARSGYRMPLIVYWNLNGSSMDCPIDNDEEHGVILLSGFSPDILKSLMEGKIRELTPLKAVLRILNNPRYAPLKVE